MSMKGVSTADRLPVSLAALLLLLAPAAFAEGLFPDPKLEAAVRRHVLAKRDNDQPLVEDDVKSLSTIEAPGQGIKDLKGLEKCRALALLDLTGNEVSSLDPLQDLKDLQSLQLARNAIRDLKPLEGLVKLQYLDLSGNEVEDLGPLAKLEALNTLYLSRNRVKDLGALSGLKRLWSLYLDGNEVSDLKPLAELKGLSSLHLARNRIEDLTPLAGHRDLKFLWLGENRLRDIAVLLESARKDLEKEKRFAPYWQVDLSGNPLPKEAVAELSRLARKVVFEKEEKAKVGADL
jgi:internalin A